MLLNGPLVRTHVRDSTGNRRTVFIEYVVGHDVRFEYPRVIARGLPDEGVTNIVAI